MLHKRKKIFEGALVKCGPFVSCFGSIADPAERCSQMSTVKLVFKPIQIHIIHFCSYSKRLTSSSAVFLFTPPLSDFVDLSCHNTASGSLCTLGFQESCKMLSPPFLFVCDSCVPNTCIMNTVTRKRKLKRRDSGSL